MFKLSVICLVLLVGQVWSILLIRQLGEEGEIVDAADNSLNDLGHSNDIIDLSFYGAAIYGDPDNQTFDNIIRIAGRTSL